MGAKGKSESSRKHKVWKQPGILKVLLNTLPRGIGKYFHKKVFPGLLQQVHQQAETLNDLSEYELFRIPIV